MLQNRTSTYASDKKPIRRSSNLLRTLCVAFSNSSNAVNHSPIFEHVILK